MAFIPKSENLVIVTQNVIPELAEIPVQNVVALITAGMPAIPVTEFTVNEKVITWNEVVAGYNIEVGEIVNANYLYDEDSSSSYDGANSSMNPVQVDYDMVVAELNIAPKLIHNPVASTLAILVNSIPVLEGVDWTRSGKVITWISGTDLEIGDLMSVTYRRDLL